MNDSDRRDDIDPVLTPGADTDKPSVEPAGQAQPDLTGKEFYGVGEKPVTPNHAWDGREPYPQDVGGINRPGQEPAGLDPLTGDRGSAEADARQTSLQFGDEGAEQPGGGTSAYEAAAPARTSDAHYAEGGFDPRGVQGAGPLEDRTLWDKATDEVKSWVGDHDAEERRKADHLRAEAEAAGGGDWQGHDDDTGWRDPVSPGKAAEADHASKPKGDDAREEPREHRPGQFRE